MIVFSNVSKWVGEKAILNDVDLSLEQGQIHCVVEEGRRNGSCSWIIKLLAGLKGVTSGKIFLGDQEVSEECREEVLSKVGLVSSEFFPDLTGMENICLGLRHGPLPDDILDERLDELMSWLGVRKELLALYPSLMGEEELIELGLIRALLSSPNYLFLDRPLDQLENEMSRKRLLIKWQNCFPLLPQTIVYLTQNLSEAVTLGDTVTLLVDGRSIKHGPKEDFLSLADQVAEFGFSSAVSSVLKDLANAAKTGELSGPPLIVQEF